MMIPTVHSIVKRASTCIFAMSVAFLFNHGSTYCQTQAPSITTGVSFQWSDTQATTNNPATIKSITVNGTVFQSVAVPSAYALKRLGPDGHNFNSVIRNGTVVNNNSSNVNWNANALAAFQDRNLNHYFNSTYNGRNLCGNFGAVSTTDAQIQSLIYNPGIPSNDGGIIAISERNANNCYYISVYGIPNGGGPEQYLGDTFVRSNSTQTGPKYNPPPAGVDYWNSGRVVENNGTIGIALFYLKDLAPIGSIITRVDLMAATVDHGDGKFFIMQPYAVPKTETACMSQEFFGTLSGNNVPRGSTFTLLSGPTPEGRDFTLNSNGTYSYEPVPGFTGEVTFDYQVCLPAPNQSICDQSTVTLNFITGPNTGCECSNGNADGPMLQN